MVVLMLVSSALSIKKMSLKKLPLLWDGGESLLMEYMVRSFQKFFVLHVVETPSPHEKSDMEIYVYSESTTCVDDYVAYFSGFPFFVFAYRFHQRHKHKHKVNYIRGVLFLLHSVKK